MSTVYVPGTEEQDLKKVIMSLQEIGGRLDTAEDNIATKVTGPASSTDNAAARFDGAGGLTAQNSVLIIADTTGALSRSGNGGIPLQGTNTNDSASAGDVGEYIESVILIGSEVAQATGTAKNITSISLTAGDWDVSAIAYHHPAATTSITRWAASISSTTDTINSTAGRFTDTSSAAIVTGGNTMTSAIPSYRLSLSGTTTIYLVWLGTFTVSTLGAYGVLRARRVR